MLVLSTRPCITCLPCCLLSSLPSCWWCLLILGAPPPLALPLALPLSSSSQLFSSSTAAVLSPAVSRSLADMFSAEEEQLEFPDLDFPVFGCLLPVLDCLGEDEEVRQVRLMSEVVSVAGNSGCGGCGYGCGGWTGAAGTANSWSSDCGGGVDFLSAKDVGIGFR